MDVARDLQDHQLLDRDGDACGRIDDILIEWDAERGRLGPLLSGGAVVLDQLGRFGRVLRRILRFSGTRREARIDWAVVGRIDPDGVHVMVPREALRLRPRRET